MELGQLEAFVTLASELPFGRAAEKLYMGQPALSELIRRLERELGVPLFIRTTQRVTLTAAGEELLIRAKAILDEVAAASAAVRRVAGARRERCGLASPRRRHPCSRRTCARYSPPKRPRSRYRRRRCGCPR